MQFITTVTQKGQVTLPLALRQAMNINIYDKVTVTAGKGHIKVEPTFDILDIAGKYKAKKGQSALKARALMEKNYSRI